MEIRLLTDGDRPALEALLRPTEPRSLFLIGNAREHGIDDRGGPFHGVWVGALDAGRLVGVAAFFRGFGSIAPACGGQAPRLVPLLLEEIARRGGRPRAVVGTAERVAEVLPHLPAPPARRLRERLLVAPLETWRPRPMAAARPLGEGDAAAVAEGLAGLQRETNQKVESDEERLALARRLIARRALLGIVEGDRLLAFSTESATSGSWLHVGATWCAPEARRRGLAGACVTAVVERARAAGRAGEGAVLFTGRENAPALGLYAKLGFRADADWELALLR